MPARARLTTGSRPPPATAAGDTPTAVQTRWTTAPRISPRPRGHSAVAPSASLRICSTKPELPRMRSSAA